MLGQIELIKIFNENDEERNHASEVVRIVDPNPAIYINPIN